MDHKKIVMKCLAIAFLVALPLNSMDRPSLPVYPVNQQNALLHRIQDPFEAYQLIQAGQATPYDTNENGLLPIHAAAQNNNAALVQFYLEGTEQAQPNLLGRLFGATIYRIPPLDINAPDAQGRTPLHHAFAAGAEGAAHALIDRGASLDCISGFGETLLHVAPHPSFIRMLLESNRSAQMVPYIDAVDGSGRTALERAAEFEDRDDVFAELLTYHPAINANNDAIASATRRFGECHGRTAGVTNLDAIRTLVRGVLMRDINAVRAALELARSGWLTGLTNFVSGSSPQSRLVNYQWHNGLWPLVAAVVSGDVRSAALLIRAGAVYNETITDPHGRSLLELASAYHARSNGGMVGFLQRVLHYNYEFYDPQNRPFTQFLDATIAGNQSAQYSQGHAQLGYQQAMQPIPFPPAHPAGMQQGFAPHPNPQYVAPLHQLPVQYPYGIPAAAEPLQPPLPEDGYYDVDPASIPMGLILQEAPGHPEPHQHDYPYPYPNPDTSYYQQ